VIQMVSEQAGRDECQGEWNCGSQWYYLRSV